YDPDGDARQRHQDGLPPPQVPGREQHGEEVEAEKGDVGARSEVQARQDEEQDDDQSRAHSPAFQEPGPPRAHQQATRRGGRRERAGGAREPLRTGTAVASVSGRSCGSTGRSTRVTRTFRVAASRNSVSSTVEPTLKASKAALSFSGSASGLPSIAVMMSPPRRTGFPRTIRSRSPPWMPSPAAGLPGSTSS